MVWGSAVVRRSRIGRYGTCGNTLSIGLAAGYGDASLSFSVLPVSTIALFAGFFIAAIVNIDRSEAHKRLILLATISLLQAAVARVFFLITGGGPGLRPGLGPPPPITIGLVPSLLVEVLILAGIIYDWRKRGRPHPVWLIGAAIMTAVDWCAGRPLRHQHG